MPGHSNRVMNGREWLLLLALSGLWGSSFYFYKVLGHSLPAFTIVLGRVGIAALVLNGLLVARGIPLGRRSPWGALLILGVLNSVVPFSLFAWGETRISSGMAGMLNATTPLFAVLLAHAIGTERLTWSRAAGVALGLAGVGVLVGPAALHNLGGDLWGDAACIVAAASYALAGQFSRRLGRLPSLQVAAGQLTGAAIILLPLAAIVDRFWALPDPGVGAWSALAGISLLGTALAYILFFRLVATAGATNAMLVTFLLPISALLLGWLFLSEMVPWRAYPGMALIGLGLAAIDGRLTPGWHALRRRLAPAAN